MAETADIEAYVGLAADTEQLPLLDDLPGLSEVTVACYKPWPQQVRKDHYNLSLLCFD